VSFRPLVSQGRLQDYATLVEVDVGVPSSLHDLVRLGELSRKDVAQLPVWPIGDPLRLDLLVGETGFFL